MRGEGAKERRYVADNGEKTYLIFDPEACLHVGKHDGEIGVVFRVRGDGWFFKSYSDDYGTNVTRGLVEWDGTGGENGVRAAAAMKATEMANVTQAPRWLIEQLCEPGRWGRREFWRELVRAYGEASQTRMIKEVMDA